MLESTKIKGKTSFIGSFNDVILNSAPGEWDFGGATINNVIVNTAGGFNNMRNTLFVEPNFTRNGIFYNTIQSAIDRAILDDKPYVILIFPGTYDEKITIDSASDIKLIGLGNVYLKFHGGESLETILIDTSENISLENITIINSNINNINNLHKVLMVKIINSGKCKLKNIKTDLNIDGITDLTFFKLLTLTDSIFFENIELYLNIKTGLQSENSYIKYIDYNGHGTEGKIKIDKCKFKLELFKIDSSYHTYVNFLKLLTNTSNNYEFVLNNCELEFQNDPHSVEGVFVDSLEAKDLSETSNKYDKIGFFNSFINVDYHIDILSQNVIKDSDFKILN